MTLAEADALRARDPDEYVAPVDGGDGRARARRCSTLQQRGAVTFDYGNNIRAQAVAGRRRRRVRHSRASCPSTSGRCSAKARGRSAGRRSRAIPADIRATDRARARDVRRTTTRCAAGSGWPASASRSRACRRASSGSATASARASASRINDLVRRGVVKAPIVIGRDHLDTGSVASPNRETEGMRDGSDAIADWPILNALLNTSSGATWVSVHHGGGVGIGYSLHAGHGDRGRRHARGRREAAARPHVRSRASASCGTPTPATRRRSTPRGRHGVGMPMRDRQPEHESMIVERPALERRVLASLDARRAIPVVLGGCGTGRTSLLLRLRAAARPRPQRSTSTSARRRRRRSAASRRCARRRRSAPAADAARRRRRVAARGRSTRSLAFLDDGRGAGGGAGDVPARRGPRLPDVRELPGPAARAARARRAPGGEPEPLRAGVALHGARASAAARRAGAVRGRFTCRALDARRGAGAGARCFDGGAPRLGARRSRPPSPALAGGRAAYVAPAARSARRAWGRATDPVAALAALLAPDGRLAARCRESYEFRLHRARGYGALKAILGVLAEEEPLTLTEIAQRLHRTPGSTKDYLSWLEDVDLVVVAAASATRFDDPLLRLCVRLHGRPVPPTDDDVVREVQRVRAGAPAARSRRAPRRAADAAAGRSGIIEIDATSTRRDAASSASTLRHRLLRGASASRAACCSASFFARPLARPTTSPPTEHLDVEPLAVIGALRPTPAGSAAGRGRCACSHSCSADFQSSVNARLGGADRRPPSMSGPNSDTMNARAASMPPSR